MPGAAAPDFTVRDLDGGAFHFAEENAKGPFLLVFWSIFCEPCRLEMPVVQKVYERHRNAGLRVAAISLDGEPLKSTITGFVRQDGYTFRILIDELDGKGMFRVSDPYGVVATPTVFVVEQGGRIAFRGVGRVGEEEIEKALQPVPAK